VTLSHKLRRLLFLVMLYLAVSVGAGISLSDGALHPARRALIREESTAFLATVQSLHAHLEDVSISARDGVTLQAWMIHPQHKTGDVVLLLHGLGDNRIGMTGYARLFLQHGFTVLLPDSRAHGASGGDLATYGLLERVDITQWVGFLRRETHPHCVYGLGESMGAAELLQSLGAGAEFCAVVAESSFSNFREIAYDRMGQPFHLGPWVGRTILRPLVEAAFLRARWKYALNMEQVSPEDAIAHAKASVLLIHGQIDSNIPVRHSRRIHRQDPQTLLWEVPEADHCGALAIAPQEFERRMLALFGSAAEQGTHLAAGR
jgi:uncharacterized protein